MRQACRVLKATGLWSWFSYLSGKPTLSSNHLADTPPCALKICDDQCVCFASLLSQPRTRLKTFVYTCSFWWCFIPPTTCSFQNYDSTLWNRFLLTHRNPLSKKTTTRNTFINSVTSQTLEPLGEGTSFASLHAQQRKQCRVAHGDCGQDGVIFPKVGTFRFDRESVSFRRRWRVSPWNTWVANCGHFANEKILDTHQKDKIHILIHQTLLFFAGRCIWV